jgi:hypothetical protein
MQKLISTASWSAYATATATRIRASRTTVVVRSRWSVSSSRCAGIRITVRITISRIINTSRSEDLPDNITDTVLVTTAIVVRIIEPRPGIYWAG